jgi:hypothetical protein
LLVVAAEATISDSDGERRHPFAVVPEHVVTRPGDAAGSSRLAEE